MGKVRDVVSGRTQVDITNPGPEGPVPFSDIQLDLETQTRLERAVRASGAGVTFIDALCTGTWLLHARLWSEGMRTGTVRFRRVDGDNDTSSSLPRGWKVVSHSFLGDLKFCLSQCGRYIVEVSDTENPRYVDLVRLTEEQCADGIHGIQARENFSSIWYKQNPGHTLFNVACIEALVQSPYLIPSDTNGWTAYRVHAFDTMFCEPVVRKYVPYMHHDRGSWLGSTHSTAGGFWRPDVEVAAVLRPAGWLPPPSVSI